jgi:hypothetical protein
MDQWIGAWVEVEQTEPGKRLNRPQLPVLVPVPAAA